MAYDLNTIEPDYISSLSGNFSQALTVKGQHVITGLKQGQSIYVTQLANGYFEISSPFVGTGGGSIFRVNGGLYLDSGNFSGVSGIEIVRSGDEGILIANGIKFSADGTRMYEPSIIDGSGTHINVNGNNIRIDFDSGYLGGHYATINELNATGQELLDQITANTFGVSQLEGLSGVVDLQGSNGITITTGDNYIDIGFSSSAGDTIFANSVFVNKSGNDLAGLREYATRPFSSLSGALAAAQAGDTIFVSPGSYTGANLCKSGISYYFEPETYIYSIEGINSGMFTYDSTSKTPCNILGYGNFILSGGGFREFIRATASATAVVEFETVTNLSNAITIDTNTASLYNFNIKGKKLYNTANGWCIATNGTSSSKMQVSIEHISGGRTIQIDNSAGNRVSNYRFDNCKIESNDWYPITFIGGCGSGLFKNCHIKSTNSSYPPIFLSNDAASSIHCWLWDCVLTTPSTYSTVGTASMCVIGTVTSNVNSLNPISGSGTYITDPLSNI